MDTASKLAPSDDEDALRAWLKERNVNVEAFGHGQAKTIAKLLTELRQGDCTLEECAGEECSAGLSVMRRVRAVWIMLRCNGRCLIEHKQIFADGRERARKTKNGRGLPVAEKIQPGERWDSAARRGLQEELSLEMRMVQIHPFVNMELEMMESSSYPGIMTEYQTWHADADLMSEFMSEDELKRLGLSKSSDEDMMFRDLETFTTYENDMHGQKATVWGWEATSDWLMMEDALDEVGINHFNFDSRINDIAFSPADTNVVTAALDNGVVLVGNLARPARTHKIKFSSTRANCVAVSSTGRYVAVGGGRFSAVDGSSSTAKRYGVRIYRLDQHQLIAEIPADDTINDVSFAQDLSNEENEFVVAFGSDAKTENSATLFVAKWGVAGDGSLVTPVFSEELFTNEWLRCTNLQSTVDRTENSPKCPDEPSAETILASQLSPSGCRLACLTASGKLVVFKKGKFDGAWMKFPRYPIEECHPKSTSESAANARACKFSGESTIVVALLNGKVILRDADSATLNLVIDCGGAASLGMDVAHGWLADACASGVHVFDAQSGAPAVVLGATKSFAGNLPHCCAIAPNGKACAWGTQGDDFKMYIQSLRRDGCEVRYLLPDDDDLDNHAGNTLSRLGSRSFVSEKNQLTSMEVRSSFKSRSLSVANKTSQVLPSKQWKVKTSHRGSIFVAGSSGASGEDNRRMYSASGNYADAKLEATPSTHSSSGSPQSTSINDNDSNKLIFAHQTFKCGAVSADGKYAAAIRHGTCQVRLERLSPENDFAHQTAFKSDATKSTTVSCIALSSRGDYIAYVRDSSQRGCCELIICERGSGKAVFREINENPYDRCAFSPSNLYFGAHDVKKRLHVFSLAPSTTSIAVPKSSSTCAQAVSKTASSDEAWGETFGMSPKQMDESRESEGSAAAPPTAKWCQIVMRQRVGDTSHQQCFSFSPYSDQDATVFAPQGTKLYRYHLAPQTDWLHINSMVKVRHPADSATFEEGTVKEILPDGRVCVLLGSNNLCTTRSSLDVAPQQTQKHLVAKLGKHITHLNVGLISSDLHAAVCLLRDGPLVVLDLTNDGHVLLSVELKLCDPTFCTPNICHDGSCLVTVGNHNPNVVAIVEVKQSKPGMWGARIANVQASPGAPLSACLTSEFSGGEHLTIVGAESVSRRSWTLCQLMPSTIDFPETAMLDPALAASQLARYPYLLWDENSKTSTRTTRNSGTELLRRRAVNEFVTMISSVPMAAAVSSNLLRMALQRRQRDAVMKILRSLLLQCPPCRRYDILLEEFSGSTLLARTLQLYPDMMAELLSSDAINEPEICSVAPSYLMAIKSEELAFSEHWCPNNPDTLDDPVWNCPRLWQPYKDDQGVDCQVSRMRLPGVTTSGVLRALQSACATKHPEVFVTSNIGNPIDKIWFEHVYWAFLSRLIRYNLFSLIFFTAFMAENLRESEGDSNGPTTGQMFLSVVLLVFMLHFLVIELRQIGRSVSYRSYFGDVWNTLQCGSLAGVAASILLHVLGRQEHARKISAITVFSLGIGSLYHLRGLEATSFLITMLFRVIVDLGGFALISIIFGVVISCTFLVLGGFDTFGDSAMATFEMMLGRLEHFEDVANAEMLNFFFVLVLVVANVVLLNLIISLISDTYSNVKICFKSYRRIDRLTLTLEHMSELPPVQRFALEARTRWLHVLTNSSSAIMMGVPEQRSIADLTRQIGEQSVVIEEQRKIIQAHAQEHHVMEEQRKIIDDQRRTIDQLVGCVDGVSATTKIEDGTVAFPLSQRETSSSSQVKPSK